MSTWVSIYRLEPRFTNRIQASNMGADGGSIPDRRDLVKTKGKSEITDRALLRELYMFCALSKVSPPLLLRKLAHW